MKKHTILFLAANPGEIDRRALDREAREIRIECSRARDRFERLTRWAAEPLDWLRERRRQAPTVVQLSGHDVIAASGVGAGLRHCNQPSGPQ